ncbi:MAG TPA: DUF6600 domain-containing protein [Chondromyces sp.]|nr:DUF6600 domain-containing protein [Chondromyces sp.]
MRSRHALAIVAAAALMSTVWVPAADAGGAVGLRIGGGNFGISVGFGDWGLYSNRWYDPGWSLDFDVVLGGYGEWIWVDGLGRCWRPWVAASWQPYRHGRWLHTSHGWTWVAYEPWGYVPHHYGSWARCNFGWVWVPGYSYAAANVVWVRAGSYIGWYARPPHGWSHAVHGFSQGYRHGVRDGYVSGYGDGYHDGWRDARYGTWVDWRHFGADNVSQHSVAHAVVSRHRVQERALAPSAQEVSRLGGGQVARARLETRTVRAGGRDVVIARPTGVESSIERHAPATVRTALSEAALERRQPQARRQVGAASPALRPQSAASRSGSRAPSIDRAPAARSAGSMPRADRAPATQRSTDSVSTAGRAPAARSAGGPSRIERPVEVRQERSRRGTQAESRAGSRATGTASSRGAAAARQASDPRPSALREAPAMPSAAPERRPAEIRPAERRARPAPARPPEDGAKAAKPRSRASAGRGGDTPEDERRVQRRPVKKRH